MFRLWWPYADPDQELVLVINYLATPSRRFTWVAPGQGTPTSGRMAPLSAPPKIGDGSGHGSYHWNQSSTVLTVKVTGGKNVELRTEPAVMVRPGCQAG